MKASEDGIRPKISKAPAPVGTGHDPCRPRAVVSDAHRLPLPKPGGPVVLSWSGGKDSAMTLHELRTNPAYCSYEVVGLLTTLNADHRRISHHGVREELLHEQALAIGLPVHTVHWRSLDGGEEAMQAFEQQMHDQLAALRRTGVWHVAFGDIYLEQLRSYREQRLRDVGMGALFPLWNQDTAALLHRFSKLQFEAIVTCAEPVASPLCGADLHVELWRDKDSWPAGVDPCGENGEFHSFVHRGPIFREPVPFRRGVTIQRDGRSYTDLQPALPQPGSSKTAKTRSK